MKIIFENQDKTVGIVMPTQECIELFGIETIAKKDVPSGLPFWIVEDDFIQSDRTFRDAWEIDSSLGESNGYGSEYCTFEEVLKNAKD